MRRPRLIRTRQPTTVRGITRTMGRVAAKWARSELALTIARRLTASVHGPDDQVGLAAVDWLRRAVKYTPEEPEVIVGLGPLLDLGAGDCDDMAAALASVLMPLGWEILWAVGWSGDEPKHVWTLARPPGRDTYQNLDASISLPAGSSPLELGYLDGLTVHTLAGDERSI